MHSNQAVVVRHPASGVLIALDPATDYDARDVLVLAYPWAFADVVNDGPVVTSIKRPTATTETKSRRHRPAQTETR